MTVVSAFACECVRERPSPSAHLVPKLLGPVKLIALLGCNRASKDNSGAGPRSCRNAGCRGSGDRAGPWRALGENSASSPLVPAAQLCSLRVPGALIPRGPTRKVKGQRTGTGTGVAPGRRGKVTVRGLSGHAEWGKATEKREGERARGEALAVSPGIRVSKP